MDTFELNSYNIESIGTYTYIHILKILKLLFENHILLSSAYFRSTQIILVIFYNLKVKMLETKKRFAVACA